MISSKLAVVLTFFEFISLALASPWNMASVFLRRSSYSNLSFSCLILNSSALLASNSFFFYASSSSYLRRRSSSFRFWFYDISLSSICSLSTFTGLNLAKPRGRGPLRTTGYSTGLVSSSEVSAGFSEITAAGIGVGVCFSGSFCFICFG